MIAINEEIFYEGGPANGDLIINLLAGLTILGLPFAFAAIRKMIKNSSIAPLLSLGGQLIEFKDFGL